MNLPHIPPFVKLAVLAAIAAAVAYEVGVLWPTIASVPAAVTAVVTTQSTASRAFRMSVLQVLGIIVGALVAVAAVHFFGYGAFTIFFMVLVCYALVIVMKKWRGISAPDAAASIAVSVIIVIGSHLSTSDTFSRFVGVLVGAGIGLLASLFVTTKSGVDQIASEVDDLYSSAATLVGDMSDGVKAGSTSEAPLWRDRAEALRVCWRQTNEEVAELETSSKWSPLMSRHETAALRKRLDALGMTVTRLVAITADLKAADKKDMFAESPEVLTPLAQLFRDVATTLDPDTESGSRSEVNKQARRMVEKASDADIDTEEFVVVSGLAQNARRLLPPETQAIPVVGKDGEDGTGGAT